VWRASCAPNEAALGPRCRNDLEEIGNYLRLHHPSVARPTIQRLYNAAKSLKAHPHLGRPGKKQGTRELVLAPLPYILIYAVDGELIHILRFLHAAKDRP
jgi:addiction module RelE/StbE family toxin